MWVIRNTETGNFVADRGKTGKGGSYTTKLQHARIYHSREAAAADRCPGNEEVLAITEAMQS